MSEARSDEPRGPEESTCKHCGQAIESVPGAFGEWWIHAETRKKVCASFTVATPKEATITEFFGQTHPGAVAIDAD